MDWKGEAMLDENTQVVQDLLAAWNAHDMERVATFLAADYEGMDVAQPNLQHGRQEQCQVLIRYLRAFPDAHITGETITTIRPAIGGKTCLELTPGSKGCSMVPAP